MSQSRKITALNAVEATTTSSAFALNAEERVSIQIVAAAITSGNGVFTVEVSNDGTNWATYNRITTNVTNTNAQTDIGVASVTLSANSNAMMYIRPTDIHAFMRVKVTRTTDGTYSAFVFVG